MKTFHQFHSEQSYYILESLEGKWVLNLFNKFWVLLSS